MLIQKCWAIIGIIAVWGVFCQINVASSQTDEGHGNQNDSSMNMMHYDEDEKQNILPEDTAGLISDSSFLDELDQNNTAINVDIWDRFDKRFLYFEGKLFRDVALETEMPLQGRKHIFAALADDNEVLIPIYDFFNILEIKATLDMNSDSLKGYFLNENQSYSVSSYSKIIVFDGDTLHAEPTQIIQTRDDILVHEDLMKEVFGISTEFNPLRMRVRFEFEQDMPYQKRKRLEQQREDQFELRNELPDADTTLGRNRSLFQLGIFDWSLSSIIQPNRPGGNRYSIGLYPGGQFAGGVFRANLNLRTDRPFELYNQRFMWEYIDNESKYFRQTYVGRGFQSVTNIRGDIYGVSTTNQSTLQRKHHSTYLISDYTEPDWTVELYKNNRFIDYVQTDETGYYEFEVPLSYGRNDFELRFYGPHGEERNRDVDINIPSQFVPAGEFEYQATAGIVRENYYQENAQDGTPTFTRLRGDYGVNRFLSLGAGYEYFSLLPEDEQHIKFGEVNLTVASSLLLNARYIHDVQSSFEANYRTPLGINLRSGMKITEDDQQVLRSTTPIERYGSIAYSFQLFNVSQSLRINHQQNVMSEQQYNRTNITHGVSYQRFSINNNVNFNFSESLNDNMNVRNNTTVSISLPDRWRLQSRAQFHINRKEMNSISMGVNKRFDNSSFSFDIQRNIPYKNTRVSLSYGYRLNFANTSFGASFSDDDYQFSQRASGGIIMDNESRNYQFKENSQNNRAGVKLIPFLDMDQTGYKSENDPLVYDVKVSGVGGQINHNEKDTIIRITGLRPYEDYHLELELGLDSDISWRLKNSTFNITTDKNSYKTIYVPINVKGEISGVVTREEFGRTFTQPRVNIFFENLETGEIFKETVSQTGGRFRNFELPPGPYEAYPNPDQMDRLNIKSQPQKHRVNLKKGLYGDYFTEADFHLVPEELYDPPKNGVTGRFNNYWMPRDNEAAGLDFNEYANGGPGIFMKEKHITNAQTLISDYDGNIVLYLNQFGNLYDQNHRQITESVRWNIERSYDFSNLLFNVPNLDNYYYLVYSKRNSDHFYYAMIETNENDSPVIHKADQKIAENFKPWATQAIRDNEGGIWLLAHNEGEDALQAFHFADGRGPWRKNTIQLPLSSSSSEYGPLLVSSVNGNKIAMLINNEGEDEISQTHILIADFNNQKGEAENFRKFDINDNKVKSMAFSPLGNKLYFAEIVDDVAYIKQLSGLSGGDSITAEIIDSFTHNDVVSLMTGPDGKVYFSQNNNPENSELGVINRPDKKGEASELGCLGGIPWGKNPHIAPALQRTGKIALQNRKVDVQNRLEMVNYSYEPESVDYIIYKQDEKIKSVRQGEIFTFQQTGDYKVKAEIQYDDVKDKQIIWQTFEVN